MAHTLPVQLAWENHLIENAQVLLLFFGGVCALAFAAISKNKQFCWFAWMVAPLWFVLCLRELSWGAVFMAPLGTHDITGPWFSSSVQLWYKPAIYPMLALVGLFSITVFLVTKQYKTLGMLGRWRSFPMLEILLAVLGSILTTAAEGHAGLSLPVTEAQGLILEEWSEFFAYFSVFVAQWRVLLAFKAHSTGH